MRAYRCSLVPEVESEADAESPGGHVDVLLIRRLTVVLERCFQRVRRRLATSYLFVLLHKYQNSTPYLHSEGPPGD